MFSPNQFEVFLNFFENLWGRRLFLSLLSSFIMAFSVMHEQSKYQENDLFKKLGEGSLMALKDIHAKIFNPVREVLLSYA